MLKDKKLSWKLSCRDALQTFGSSKVSCTPCLCLSLNNLGAALSTLVASSLQEDPYGRVQRDIPRVLEALVAYLGALEQLVDEMNVEPTPYTEDAIKRVVQPVADGEPPFVLPELG